jgi:hypothetical protein
MKPKLRTKESLMQRQLKELKQAQEKTDCLISFRLTTNQLTKIKKEAQKQQRTLSNYLRTKLF